MPSHRSTTAAIAVALALAVAACGSDTPTALDADARSTGDGDSLVHPDTPAEDVAGDPVDVPDADAAQDPAADPAGGIEPAEGVVPPEQAVVTGRVVGVDRDGPSVEIVESTIVTGSDATDAARAAGAIGPDEEWDADFYVMEGARRWVDIDPAAAVAVYDCTQACEHVAGTIDHVLAGAPYGGADALWNFSIGADGRATAADEVYLP